MPLEPAMRNPAQPMFCNSLRAPLLKELQFMQLAGDSDEELKAGFRATWGYPLIYSPKTCTFRVQGLGFILTQNLYF